MLPLVFAKVKMGVAPLALKGGKRRSRRGGDGRFNKMAPLVRGAVSEAD